MKWQMAGCRTASASWCLPVLFFLPLVIAIYGAFNIYFLSPIYAQVGIISYDPTYAYLFNGLAILTGAPPGLTEHPGTTSQVLIALSLGARFVISGINPFDRSAAATELIRDPELYITSVESVILCLNVAAIAFLGIRVWRASNNIGTAVIAQSFPLFFGGRTQDIFSLTAESGLVLSSALLLGFLAPIIFRFRSSDLSPALSKFEALGAGVSAGLGLSAKVTFAPLLLLLLVIRGKKSASFAFLGLAVVIATTLLIISHRLLNSLKWLTNLATHTGRYGGGDAGVFDASTIPGNLNRVWDHLPVFYIGVACCLIVLLGELWRSREARTGISRTVFVSGLLLLTLATSLMMVLKHFEFHYFIASISVALLSVACAHAWMQQQLSFPYSKALALMVAVGVPAWGIYSAGLSVERSYLNSLKAKTVMDGASQYLKAFPGAVVVNTYLSPNVETATQFGIAYTGATFGKYIGDRFDNSFVWYEPNDLFYRSGKAAVTRAQFKDEISNKKDVFVFARTQWVEKMVKKGFVVTDPYVIEQYTIARLSSFK